jgi:hypothetical protein
MLRLSKLVIFVVAISAICAVARAHEHQKDELSSGSEKTVTGEVVDLMCYLDHAAMGDEHATCAGKCIRGGGPAGIVSDGKAYLVVGEHKSMNDELAPFAGKTITVKGKLAERGGMAMIENAQIVKK